MDTPGEIKSAFSRLPSALQQTTGWAEFFELQRSSEPHLHQIEPTNHCPYTCIMCPRTKKMDRTLGFMDFEIYRKAIDEVGNYKNKKIREKEIELFHFGESLLHPRIEEMVGYASSKGLNITLSVNGPDLTPEVSAKILKNNPYKIILSLDGYDTESYRNIRGKKADFDKAISNIDALLVQHRQAKTETQIIIRMIEMEINKEHTQSFAAMWNDKGAEVEIREFFPWTEEEMVSLGKVNQYSPQMPCPFPWRYVVVQWNGDVVPCCRDYNGVNVMGNIKDATLVEIWNGENYREFRKMFAEKQWGENSLCSGCMNIYFNDH